MKKDLLVLTQSLMAYYHRGMIGLMQVPDINSPISSGFLKEAVKHEPINLIESNQKTENAGHDVTSSNRLYR